MKNNTLLLVFFASVVTVFAADVSSPISLKIALVGDTARIGSEIRVRVTLTNLTEQQITIASGPAELIYKVEFRDSSGKAVPEKQYFRFGSIAPFELPPGATQKTDLLLSKMYELTQPGTYVIQVSRQSRHEPGVGTENAKSNVLILTVALKQEPTSNVP